MLQYKMRLAICDDEQDMLESIAAMTRDMAAQEHIQCEIDQYRDAESLLAALQGGADYHALFLDVVMGGMSGMELAAKIRKWKSGLSIVFISSNREMAILGYEVSASRFLTKPVAPQKLREALLLCYEAGKREQFITLPTEKGVRRLPAADIVYAETWGRGLRIFLADGSENVSLKISELEDMLPANQFIMCHRTVLVNLAFVKYLRYCELELKTGAALPVSKYRQNDVREKLFSYLAD